MNTCMDGKIDKAHMIGVTKDVIFARKYITLGEDLLLIIFM